MRLKVGLFLLLMVAVFPALTVGVAQQTVHAALQAVSGLVGSPHG